MIKKCICPKCGREFEIDTKKSNRIFCSRTCANSHILSKDTKNKISKSLVKYYSKELCKCKICGKEITANKRVRFCSEKCKHINNFYKSLIKYFGLDIMLMGTENFINDIIKIKNNLYDLYWNKELTSTEICKKYNYPNVGNLTGKIFKYLNIPVKSCKERNNETVYYRIILKDNKSIYKHGWFTTWDNKEVYLRSSYEYDYANILNLNKIKYDVECLRIQYFDSQLNKFRCAIPDFYLIDTNTIVEVKSTWTLNIQNMKDKFAEYKKLGYNVKLFLNKKEVDLYSL